MTEEERLKEMQILDGRIANVARLYHNVKHDTNKKLLKDKYHLLSGKLKHLQNKQNTKRRK